MSELGTHKLTQRPPFGFKTGGVGLNLRQTILPLLLIIVHIPLGLVLYRSNLLAFIHPMLVFLLGFYWAINKRVRIERVAAVVAYLAAVEVLWRMAQAPIFWEFGKYGSVVIMVAALVQRRKWEVPKLPLLYFAFLLPSTLLTLADFSLSQSKDKISFNLSGPFVLFVACWFFSHVKVDRRKLRAILLIMTVPLISIAVTTLFYTVTTPDIQFNTESNFGSSGGYGPNQVSSILGLGVFLCLSIYLMFKNDLSSTVYLILLTLLFTAQSVMTFSRGGIYSAIGATLAVLLFQVREMSRGARKLMPIIGAGVVFLVLIFPYLNAFTGGKLQERFEERTTTKRADIIRSDLQLFLDNPIFGVGLGEAYARREKLLGYKAASHTEFSRTVSEHGIFGILALLTLGVATFHNLKRQRMSFAKAFVSGVVVWSSLFMLSAGMRLAAPSILWGLSFLTFVKARERRRSPAIRSRPPEAAARALDISIGPV